MKALLLALLTLPLLAQTSPRTATSTRTPATPPKVAYGLPQENSAKAPMMAGPAQQVSMAQLQLRDAAVAGDIETLGRMLAGDCLITLPSGAVLNRTRLIDAIRTNSRYERLEFSDMQVRMPAPAVGVVTARVDATGETHSAYRLTAVWQKLPTGWKVVVMQVTAVL